MDFEEKTLKRESKFKGHIFEVAVDEVLLPDGKTAGRELIFHKGAVAVLAVTPEGKIIIVKQYRKAIESPLQVHALLQSSLHQLHRLPVYLQESRKKLPQ